MYDFQKLLRPKSLAEALDMLAAEPGARILAGGSDLLLRAREGKLREATLVSIYGLPELRGVSLTDSGAVRILPLTTFDDLERDPVVSKRLPALSMAGASAGGPQLRNIGSIGGNICNGATSADTAPSLFAHNAALILQSASGVRTVPVSEFYAGPGRVNIQRGELLTAIEIYKEDYDGFGGYYYKYSQRNAMDISTLGCAALVRLSPDLSSLAEIRLAFGVAAPTPVRCPSAEAEAAGRVLTEESLRAVAKAALRDVNPRSSWRAGRDFRLHLVEELAARALRYAAENAGGAFHA